MSKLIKRTYRIKVSQDEKVKKMAQKSKVSESEHIRNLIGE